MYVCSFRSMHVFAERVDSCPHDGSAVVYREPHESLDGSTLEDRYRLISERGRGAMGVVYYAEDLRLGIRVAVKVLAIERLKDPDLIARFLREARIGAMLNHPNCARVFDVNSGGPPSLLPFIVMEWLEGESLAKRLSRGTPPIESAIKYSIELADGLSNAHQCEVVHRDLKPDNVVLAEVRGSTVVKIIDFGIAKLMREQGLTARGDLLGTPAYMAPEQAQDGSAANPQSDIYAAGAIMYEMLTGRPIVGGDTLASLLELVRAGRIDRHPRMVNAAVPEWLDTIVARCLSHAPGERFASASDLKVALEVGVVASGPVAPGRVNPSAPTLLKPTAKLGVLISQSGTMALSEMPVGRMTEMAIDEVNRAGGVIGHYLEPETLDAQSDDDVVAMKAEMLAAHGAKALFGCWTSSGRKAVLPILEARDLLLCYPVQYEGYEDSQQVLYTGATPNMQILPAIQWCLRQGWRRMFFVGSNYVFPHMARDIIAVVLRRKGMRLVGHSFIERGSFRVDETLDRIAESGADVVLNCLNGDSNWAFFRGLARRSGHKGAIPAMSFSVSEVELSLIGKRVTQNHFAAWNYFMKVDTPANRQFMENVRRRFGAETVVNDPAEAAYLQVHLYAKAVAAAESFSTDRVRAALPGLRFDAPGGEVVVHANRHISSLSHIGQVNSEGQFNIVWSSPHPIAPNPYPFPLDELRSAREELDRSGASPGDFPAGAFG
jgi:urea transport system substrate-binding protein